jgi:endoglucanase
VDQYGYLPGSSKVASWLSASDAPATWELVDDSGTVLASGETVPLGPDQESGDSLHAIDFSEFQTPSKDLSLRVGDDHSRPITIAADLYAPLFRDAVRYFYLNRSGVDLVMPFAGNARWTRPAGHVSDSGVPCLADSPCDAELDVSGGWYDAGDYGKYVVNGGLSTWLLLSTYELSLIRGQASWLSDGQLQIPESGNGVPDVLDEARFELEFMLKMQVPEGQPLAGMVHHKIHDEKWAAMGKAPTPQTEIRRFVHPPSTAASLNLAAAAALASRLYATFDPAFAERCLAAAKLAFDAAQAHPDQRATNTSHTGGGSYADEQLDDDFYWAAAELWVTTGSETYAKVVQNSPYLKLASAAAGGVPASFDWGTTDVPGSMTLLLHAGTLAAGDEQHLKAQIVEHAERYLMLMGQQGYRFPFAKGPEGYPWGSNSFITNNAAVLAFAHHLTGQAKYRAGAEEALHFLLGRNANDMSYISGYGQRSMSHPHHRFWAPSVDETLPPPPPGALAGGPNSRLQDPPMKADKQGCALQKCYLDVLEAYSVNEVAINWNASLAWVVGYLAAPGSP